MLREVKIRVSHGGAISVCVYISADGQDQNLQEAGVKVETLERRLEATRKQADQIVELENDVAKAKKQEKVYEDAIEQLQKDLDLLEAENAKLGKGDRQPSSTALEAPTQSVIVDHGAVSEQVENLRAAIRYLRRENSLLKGKELYKDLKLLPALPASYTAMEDEVPELDPSSPDSPSSDSDAGSSVDGLGPVTPSKYTVEMESKLLWKEVSEWTAAPKIVDMSKAASRGWTRRKGGPEEQVWAWSVQEKELGRRVERLKDRSRLVRR
jgi:dynactin 1